MRLIIFFLFCNFSLQPIFAQQQKMRVAVAGTSHGHAAFIFGRPSKGDLEIVGIYEPDTAVARLRMRQFKLPAELFYTDLDKMLDATKPTAVLAFGSTFEHRKVVEAAAPRHMHIMVEKPLATTLEDARYMHMLAQKNKVYLLTDYETSWYPSVAKTFELIEDSSFTGQPRKIFVNDGHKGPKEIGCGPEFLDWLTDPVLNGGGALMDFGCYGANLMTRLAHNRLPISVTAVTRQFKPDVYPKVDDDATILLDYGDMQCTINASWNWTFNRKDMEIYGDKAYIKALDKNTLVRKSGERSAAEIQRITDQDIAVYEDPFSYMIDVIKGKQTIQPEDLYATDNNVIVVAILQAARESAKTGKTVYMSAIK